MLGISRVSRIQAVGLCVAILKQCFGLKVAYNFGPLGHLNTAKHIWKSIIRPGDTVIDATCGNGHDSLHLAELALSPTSGRLYCIDIQSDATTSTREKFTANASLQAHLDEDRVRIITASHETFPADINPASVALVCYNLGYLPTKRHREQPSVNTANRRIITETSTTIISLTNALPLIKEGGLLSVTAYPGHEGGDTETEEVRKFLSALDDRVWRVYGSFPLNRPKSPILMSAFKIDKSGSVLRMISE